MWGCGESAGVAPSEEDMAASWQEYVDLYAYQDAPGEMFELDFEPYRIGDTLPMDGKVDLAVRNLHNGKAAGPSKN